MNTQDDKSLLPFQAFVINLDRAQERWEKIQANLERVGIPYARVAAVLGDDLPDAPEGYSVIGYRILTGKEMNKREVGCYFSHIEAMRKFLKSKQEYALIVEDDAVLRDGLPGLLLRAIGKPTGWDMLRLCSSKKGSFLCFERLDAEHCLAYNLKPLKNTAAYLLNRHAARCCVERLLPMKLPYDVALDREWAYGFRTACIFPLPVQLDAEVPGQIPKARRIRLYRSTSFHAYHLWSHLQRVTVRLINYATMRMRSRFQT